MHTGEMLDFFHPDNLVSCVAPGESPQNVTVDEIMSDSFLVSWIPPSAHLHNGILRQYLVEVKADDSNKIRSLSTAATSLFITDLHPDRSYLIRVAGHTVETGPYSNSEHLRTLEDGI